MTLLHLIARFLLNADFNPLCLHFKTKMNYPQRARVRALQIFPSCQSWRTGSVERLMAYFNICGHICDKNGIWLLKMSYVPPMQPPNKTGENISKYCHHTELYLMKYFHILIAYRTVEENCNMFCFLIRPLKITALHKYVVPCRVSMILDNLYFSQYFSHRLIKS